MDYFLALLTFLPAVAAFWLDEKEKGTRKFSFGVALVAFIAMLFKIHSDNEAVQRNNAAAAALAGQQERVIARQSEQLTETKEANRWLSELSEDQKKIIAYQKGGDATKSYLEALERLHNAATEQQSQEMVSEINRLHDIKSASADGKKATEDDLSRRYQVDAGPAIFYIVKVIDDALEKLKEKQIVVKVDKYRRPVVDVTYSRLFEPFCQISLKDGVGATISFQGAVAYKDQVYPANISIGEMGFSILQSGKVISSRSDILLDISSEKDLEYIRECRIRFSHSTIEAVL